MYRVVGCRECGALWIVADRPETTGCPRCGTRHPFERLHAFAETEDEDAARQARSALLADRAGRGDAFAEVDDGRAAQLDVEAGSEMTELEAAGLDPAELADAGERATGTRTTDHRETVLGALEALDRPTRDEIIDCAAQRDVPAESVPSLLDRLVRAGEVSESGGRYRRL